METGRRKLKHLVQELILIDHVTARLSKLQTSDLRGRIALNGLEIINYTRRIQHLYFYRAKLKSNVSISMFAVFTLAVRKISRAGGSRRWNLEQTVLTDFTPRHENNNNWPGGRSRDLGGFSVCDAGNNDNHNDDDDDDDKDVVVMVILVMEIMKTFAMKTARDSTHKTNSLEIEVEPENTVAMSLPFSAGVRWVWTIDSQDCSLRCAGQIEHSSILRRP
ncbi:hypothetical protein ElyMa_003690200 [Elysia marginata]|uniref:Uncharacterized protein n=1 Tax=Elysia marginata TaxID=1093978 RepID=A0AAV4F162_9GAST|nr:hypothetical protein ElyMa_003690200 [Elysia marginata]